MSSSRRSFVLLACVASSNGHEFGHECVARRLLSLVGAPFEMKPPRSPFSRPRSEVRHSQAFRRAGIRVFAYFARPWSEVLSLLLQHTGSLALSLSALPLYLSSLYIYIMSVSFFFRSLFCPLVKLGATLISTPTRALSLISFSSTRPFADLVPFR
jgi:hypothetical protein